MNTLMRAEDWTSGRESYVFRCVRSNGERWTFVVGRQALEDLAPAAADLNEVFEQYRSRIYLAARRRMESGQADQQHVLTAQDILDAG